MVLRDDNHGIPELQQHFQAPARKFKPPLDRLIRIGHSTHGDDFRGPSRRRKLFAQQVGRVFLDHDFAFKVQPGGEAQVFMRWPGVTVDASVFTAAIRIDAGFEPDVWAVIVTDDGTGSVLKELRPGQGILFRITFEIGLEMDFIKAVGRVAACAACGERVAGHTVKAYPKKLQNELLCLRSMRINRATC